jgi:hypothetical protein
MAFVYALTAFLVRIHAHVNDYWRFTPSGLKMYFSGLGNDKIYLMGLARGRKGYSLERNGTERIGRSRV